MDLSLDTQSRHDHTLSPMTADMCTTTTTTNDDCSESHHGDDPEFSGDMDGGLEDLGELLGSMQTMLTQDRIAQLASERNEWKFKADEAIKFIDVLQKRMAAKSATSSTLDADFVARLNRLEWENRHLATENSRLKKEMQESERQAVLLHNENEGKSRKLRGAHKKAQNAKDMAVKEEEKAKEAVNQRDQRLKLQRQQQKDMKAALAEAENQKKMVQALESDLHIARSGHPYLRDEGSAAEEATAAVSVSLKIKRKHFPFVKSMLVDTQAEMTASLVDAYNEWQEQQKTGTGYEHDGRRSIRHLQTVANEAAMNHLG